MIDGVENIIPQCTRYRVLNKAEQLRKHGFEVKVVNLSEFELTQAQMQVILLYIGHQFLPELPSYYHKGLSGKPIFF